MNEEIIKKCAFYKLGVCISPINKDCKECKDIDISKCYFKQLKQLQQENEELGKIIDCKTGTIQSLAKVRDDLKRENYELKSRLKTLDDEVITIEITPNEFERYKKYKQALVEIREEIWEQNRSCDNCPDERSGYCIGFNECAKNIIDNFLLKIGDVLND